MDSSMTQLQHRTGEKTDFNRADNDQECVSLSDFEVDVKTKDSCVWTRI